MKNGARVAGTAGSCAASLPPPSDAAGQSLNLFGIYVDFEAADGGGRVGGEGARAAARSVCGTAQYSGRNKDSHSQQ